MRFNCLGFSASIPGLPSCTGFEIVSVAVDKGRRARLKEVVNAVRPRRTAIFLNIIVGAGAGTDPQSFEIRKVDVQFEVSREFDAICTLSTMHIYHTHIT